MAQAVIDTMLNVGPPKQPKTGTSRWFKGRRDVPDPNDPALYDDYDHDYGDENPSPCFPPTKQFSMPPPRSLLPPQPRAADEPPSGPSLKDIPHRPAGKELSLQPAQQPQKQSGLQTPPPSPAESLSNILSAYNRTPGESLVSSSDGASTNSNRQSEANTSSIYDPLLPNTNTNMLSGSVSAKQHHHQHQDQQQHAAPEPPVKDSHLPPRPSKNSKFYLQAKLAPQPRPKLEADVLSIKLSRLLAQQQLGFRHCRSSKTDWRSLKPLDQKLLASYGTSAATKPTVDLVATSQLTQRQRPGGVIEVSTPECQKEHIKTPIFDSFISPPSPSSSQEPAAEAPPELPGGIPQPPTQQGNRVLSSTNVETKLIAHEARPLPKLLSPVKTRLPSKSSAKAESPMVQSLLPLVTDLARNQGSAGSEPPGAHTRYLPLQSSARSNQDARLVQSESGKLLYQGRDGTLYSEMKVPREPDPRAAYFPKQADIPIANGIIIKAPPLKESHFNCYYRHRIMNRRTNIYYPLTCQACEKSDIEERWTCMFCHLRICESCVQKLNRNGRDLRRLVDEMKAASRFI